jgi:hypothetical protein
MLARIDVVLIAIPILAVVTSAITCICNIPHGIVPDDETNDLVNIVDILDTQNDGRSPVVTKSIQDIVQNVDSTISLPYLIPVPSCLADLSSRNLSEERSRKAFSTEMSYQAALTSTGSFNNSKRRLMLQSAVDAVEAGLFSVAKSRLQNTFLPPYSPFTNKETKMRSHPPSSAESLQDQKNQIYNLQNSPLKNESYEEMKSWDKLSSGLINGGASIPHLE